MRLPELYDCSILIVDDEEANLDLLEGFLHAEGFRRIICVADARLAVAQMEAHAADVVLLDLHMPHLSGFDVLEAIRGLVPPGDYLPVLVLTADATPSAKERALSAGARDFVTKPFDAMEVVLRVRNLLETRVLHRREREARRRAEGSAARAALLADASRALGASLDGATAASLLARRLVPALGDACALLHHDDDGLEPMALWPVEAPEAAPIRRIACDRRLFEMTGEDRPRAIRLQDDGGAGGAAIFAAPLQTSAGMAGLLVLARDDGAEGWSPEEAALLEEIAARTSLALENTQLFAAAESARRARERMLSVAAHDLRNPLAAIAIYAEMMLSLLPPGGGGYQREALSSIFQSAGRMQQLIDELLDVSALQQGIFPLRRQDQPLDRLMREAEQMLRPLAEARGIELVMREVDVAGFPPITLDGARLLQVHSNLIGNALKFSPPEAQVEVGVDAVDGQLHFFVADRGPGIPDEQIPHIFDAFRKLRSERRGVGLGLWIARAIVEAHGGRIWVEGRRGAGAIFRFTIPDARAAEREVARLWID